MREDDPARVRGMTAAAPGADKLPVPDDATRAIVRLSGAIASLDEAGLRPFLADAARRAPGIWIEEVILQAYLFAGFPRALNAMREWRRISGTSAPESDAGTESGDANTWRVRGEATCAHVYGPFYDRLRHNIRALHPALDAWMIVEGYGKVLSREGLDLARRELCVIAACAAARQDRQLHSHLHGALHVGATPDEVEGALEAVSELLQPNDVLKLYALWNRVRPPRGRSPDVH
jgi:4-carboxymuconolactone decarboxylase